MLRRSATFRWASVAILAWSIYPAFSHAAVGKLDLVFDKNVKHFRNPPQQQVVRSESECGRDSPDTQLLGGGSFFKHSKTGQVQTSSSAPYRTRHQGKLRSWVAVGDNVSGNSSIAFGESEVCGSVDDVAYVREATSVPRRGYAPLIAFCPRGSRVIGGGGYTPAPLGAMRLVESYPYRQSGDGDPNSWRIWFENKSNERHQAVAYAICSKIRGLRYPSATAHVDRGSRATTVAKCPRGTYVLAGGIFAPKVVSRSAIVRTTFAGPAPRFDRWRGTVDNLTGHGARLTTVAVCHQ